MSFIVTETISLDTYTMARLAPQFIRDYLDGAMSGWTAFMAANGFAPIKDIQAQVLHTVPMALLQFRHNMHSTYGSDAEGLYCQYAFFGEELTCEVLHRDYDPDQFNILISARPFVLPA